MPHSLGNNDSILAFFVSFKSNLTKAFNDWHIVNFEKTLSNYNVAELTKSAILVSLTPENIVSGFGKPGIWIFRRLAFGSAEFVPLKIFDGNYQNDSAETYWK